MRVLNHLDLFTGIGGFALAARWMGWQTVGFVEIDEWCQSVLRKRFKNVPIYGNIKTTDFKQFRGSVDIVTGGFPCQPFSYAGSREQKEDERYLWPEMYRVVREIKPKYKYAPIWKTQGTKLNRLVLRQVASEAITFESGIGLLPTPQAWDGKMYAMSLEHCIKRLGTQKGPGREANNGNKRQMSWIHWGILF